MSATEKFSLRWNDFESNISVAFRELREEKDFFDVTLSVGPGHQHIQAHKLILSACSPFFRGVLRQNPHAHPLLYLKGVGFSELQSVLNFMYHGEVNVAQEELNTFLAVAEELQEVVPIKTEMPTSYQSSPQPAAAAHHAAGTVAHMEEEQYGEEGYDDYGGYEGNDGFGDGSMMEGDQNKDVVASHAARTEDGKFSCTLCQHVTHKKYNMRIHLEAHELSSKNYSCTTCGTVVTTRQLLRQHQLGCQKYY